MSKQSLVIVAPNGLHIRPLGTIVQEAKKFTSDISITSEGKTASAKSLFKLQTLNLAKGNSIDIEATGDDADAAVAALVALIPTLE